LSTGASSQTPLGELTALPQAPSWVYGALFLRGWEGKDCRDIDVNVTTFQKYLKNVKQRKNVTKKLKM